MISLDTYYSSSQFKGTSGTTIGREGYVPQVQIGESGNYLRGDGKWIDFGLSNLTSTYTTVKSLSDSWEESAFITPLQSASASWNSVYTTVKSLSDSWEESAFITPLQSASASWNSVYTTVNSNSSLYSGIEKVSGFKTDAYNFDLDQYTIYTKRVTGENVFTYQNFVSGRTLTVYLCADHPQAIGHYFPLKTYFGDNGNSNIAYTFSGYSTKLIIQNVGDYYLGSTFLIPYNVVQYAKIGDSILEEGIGFILQEDNYRILLE